MSVGSAAHHRRLRPPALPPERFAQRGGARLVDVEALALEDDAVILAGTGARHELVLHVARHSRPVALEGIAPAARSRRAVAEHVAALHRHRELAGKLPVLGARILVVLAGPTLAAPVELVLQDVVTVH